METLQRTSAPLPHVRLLLVGKVRARLQAAGAGRAGRGIAALSGGDTPLPDLEHRAHMSRNALRIVRLEFRQ